MTSVDESTLAGVSGATTRTYTFELDHDFRRWLTAIGRFTYGTQEYQGSTRSDQVYSISGDLVYKLSREFQIKAQVRRDILNSNISGAGSAATCDARRPVAALEPFTASMRSGRLLHLAARHASCDNARRCSCISKNAR